MMMTDQTLQRRINDAARRYFDGATTAEEERLLRRFLATPAGRDPHYDDLRAVMAFTAMGRRRAAQRRRTKALRPRLAIGVAASLFLSVGISLTLRFTPAAVPDCYALVGGRYITDPDAVAAEMEQTMSGLDLASPEDIATSTLDDLLAPPTD